MKKSLIITALAVLLSLIMPISSFAGAEMRLSVIDEADVLTDTEEEKLTNKLNGLVKEHKMHFVIVIVNDTGSNMDSYADSFYYDNGYGYGKDKSGILLLLVMSLNECGIYTYGDADEEFSDGDINDLEDAMLPHFRKDEFYDGFMAYAEACDDALSFDVWGSMLIAVVIGAVVALIIVFSMKSKLKSVRPQKTASNYVREGSFMLTKDLDLYLYRTVTRTRRADNNSGGRSGGGSRSASHRGGGKF